MPDKSTDDLMSEIHCLSNKIIQTEDALAQAKRDIPETIKRLSADLPQQRLEEFVTDLYWHTDVPVASIAEGFNLDKIHLVRRIAGKHPPTWTCPICAEQIVITSRTNRDEVDRSVCVKCKEEERRKYFDDMEVKRQLARERELRFMPYQQYLNSAEWKNTRARKLSQAGYRCQVCNSNNLVLNVHHRTYKRRGKEYLSDLIVLCSDCHELFHTNKHVVKE